MSTVLNISEAASLAIHAMAYMAGEREKKRVSVSEIAEVLGVSGAHLSKVLQRLARMGLLESRRGPRGGFALGMEPREITLLEIYEAMDGPLERRTCLLNRHTCESGDCVMGNLVESIQLKVREHLAETRLSNFIQREFPRLTDRAN